MSTMTKQESLAKWQRDQGWDEPRIERHRKMALQRDAIKTDIAFRSADTLGDDDAFGDLGGDGYDGLEDDFEEVW